MSNSSASQLDHFALLRDYRDQLQAQGLAPFSSDAYRLDDVNNYLYSAGQLYS